MEAHERLKLAREQAGFETPTDAARRFGWPPSTYIAHENGNRGFPAKRAEVYASAFKVPAEWLLFGRGTASAIAEAVARLVAIYEALPDQASRDQLLQDAETIALAARYRSQRQ